ncbi:hypothetical protein ACOMHN_025332 [Nucella lapillus]
MRGAECWSHHRLFRRKTAIQLALKNKSTRDKPMRGLNIGCLCTSRYIMQEKECLSSIHLTGEDTGEEWTAFKESLYTTAAGTLGFV